MNFVCSNCDTKNGTFTVREGDLLCEPCDKVRCGVKNEF